MTNLHLLRDAFAELERQADTVSYDLSSDTAKSHTRWPPALLIAATVGVVAMCAGLIAATHPHNNAHTATAPARFASVVATAPHKHSSLPPARHPVPPTPKVLARRFRSAVGGTAKVTIARTVVRVGNPYIEGTLKKGGLTVRFDLSVYEQSLIGGAGCRPGAHDVCAIKQSPNGRYSVSLVTDSTNHWLHEVNLVQANGTALLWHLLQPTSSSPRSLFPVAETIAIAQRTAG